MGGEGDTGGDALVSSVRSTSIYTRAGSWGATHCYVPYLRGKALPAARNAIDSMHCRVGKVTRISVAGQQQDRVISQKPKPGTRLAKDATVDLKVQKIPPH